MGHRLPPTWIKPGLLIVLASLVLAFYSGAAKAQSFATVLAGADIVGGRLLDKAKNNADAVAANLAARIRALVDYARSQYSEALQETLEGVDTERRKFFRGLQGLMADGDAYAQGNLSLAQRLTDQISIIASQLPGSRWGFIHRHEPSFIMPSSQASPAQRISLAGNGFSEAAIECGLSIKGACHHRISSDGEILLDLSNFEKSQNLNEIDSFDIKIKIKKGTRYFWPFGGKDEVAYTIPILRLPEKPVHVELYRVRQRPRAVESHRQLHGGYKLESGKSHHESGCLNYGRRGNDWKIDLESSSVQIDGQDDGNAWFDKAHSTPELMLVCWTAKPAKKHVKRGYVSFSVNVVQNRLASEPFTEDKPMWEGDLDWDGQQRIDIKLDDGVNWHVTADPIWGPPVQYDEKDAGRPVEVSDYSKDKGFILIKVRAPGQIGALQKLGIR